MDVSSDSVARVALTVGVLAVACLSARSAVADDPEALVFCEDSGQCSAGEACVAGLCSSLARAQVPLLFPISVDRITDVVAGRRSGPVPDRVSAVLRRYLEMSGLFVLLPGTASPPSALLEAMRITTIDFQSWYDAGAYAVVKGAVEPGGSESSQLTLRLYIVEDGVHRPLPHDVQSYTTGDEAALKAVVARWVDELIAELTGREGPFQMRLACAHRTVRGAPKEILVLDADGGGERFLTHNGSINMLPAWTTRGEVAYTSFLANNPDLYVGERKLSHFRRMNSGAAFHPDGERLALTLSKDGNAEIYVLSAKDGSVVLRVTDDPAIDTSPTWSRDGRDLAFVSDRGTGRPQIYHVTLGGEEPIRLPQVGGYNSSPDWSPTADLIAYSAKAGGERYDIYLIDVLAGTVRRLTSEGSNEEPNFSRDGRYIAYTSTRGGSQAIWVMTVEGRNHVQVSSGPGVYSTPAWQR